MCAHTHAHTFLCDAVDRMASDSDIASFISGTDRDEEAGEGGYRSREDEEAAPGCPEE